MANIDNLLEQLGSSMVDFRARSKDVEALAKNNDASLSEIIESANMAAKARIRFADTVEELISANNLTFDAVNTYSKNLNSKLLEYSSVIGINSTRMKNLAERMRDAAGVRSTAVLNNINQVIQDIEQNTDDLAEQQEATINTYFDNIRDFLGNINTDAQARIQFLTDYRNELQGTQNKIDAQVASTQQQFQAKFQAGAYQKLQDIIYGAGISVNIEELMNNNANTVDAALQLIRQNRQALVESMGDEDRAVFTRLTNESEKLLEVYGKREEL
jgi:hypothetical protein